MMHANYSSVTVMVVLLLANAVSSDDSRAKPRHVGGGHAEASTGSASSKRKHQDFNRLGKWNQLDSTLQTRMFHRLSEAFAAASSPDSSQAPDEDKMISVAWAYVRNEVCLKGVPTFLANIKRREGCSDEELRVKSARRACKSASLTPGNLLLGNCTAAFARVCENFFRHGGLPTPDLCDAVGMDVFELKRKEEPNYDL